VRRAAEVAVAVACAAQPAARIVCIFCCMTDQAARLADALADRYRIDRELGAVGMTRSNLALLLTGPSRTAPCSLRSLVASC